jgi:hypothetical protein
MHVFHRPQRSRPSRGTIAKDTDAQGRNHELRGQIIHVSHHKLTDNFRPSKWRTAIILIRRSSRTGGFESKGDAREGVLKCSKTACSVPGKKPMIVLLSSRRPIRRLDGVGIRKSAEHYIRPDLEKKG